MNRTYVYDAEFIRVLENGRILLNVDLGFGIRNERVFRLFVGEGIYLYGCAWDAIEEWLSAAESILIKTIRSRPEQFSADITFSRDNNRWYNVAHLLAENDLTWKGGNASSAL